MDVLPYQLVIDLELIGLVQPHHARQVAPRTRCDKLAGAPLGLHVIEAIRPHIKEARHSRMHPVCHGVLAPGCQVRLYLDALDAIHRHHVKSPSALVVFKRVACAHDDPAVWHAVVAEHLALQKAQHHRHEGLAHAVDLVEEQDTLAPPCPFYALVDAGDDLAHGVLGDIRFMPAKAALGDKGQPDGRLARMVSHRIIDEPQVELGGNLRHDGGLADARRTQEEDGSLRLDGHDILAKLVFGEIGDASFTDLLLCLLDVHLSLAFGCAGCVSCVACIGCWVSMSPAFGARMR